MISGNNGVLYEEDTKKMRNIIWDKYYINAPEQRRKFVER
ncbi:hypothetical protein MIDIC_180003 [Alphaproteobacteria bacterium]